MKTTEKETAVGLAFKVMGETDDVTNCYCCGRQGLKSTVALLPLDADGGPADEVVYFGVVCAAKAMHQSVKYVREQLTEVEKIERARKDASARAEMDAYSSWLVANYGVRQPADLFLKNVKPIDALNRYRAERKAA